MLWSGYFFICCVRSKFYDVQFCERTHPLNFFVQGANEIFREKEFYCFFSSNAFILLCSNINLEHRRCNFFQQKIRFGRIKALTAFNNTATCHLSHLQTAVSWLLPPGPLFVCLGPPIWFKSPGTLNFTPKAIAHIIFYSLLTTMVAVKMRECIYQIVFGGFSEVLDFGFLWCAVWCG